MRTVNIFYNPYINSTRLFIDKNEHTRSGRRIDEFIVCLLYTSPYSSQGWVYRTGDGCLKCAPGHEEFFEQHRQSFWMGNKANLELLKKAPDQIAGNINSFEAYGACYSVLSLHGGRTLEQILRDRQWGGSLRDITTCLLQILDSLEQFHKNGILHLDISPDNILILPQRVLLIDYNSVWPVHRTGDEKLYYSRCV